MSAALSWRTRPGWSRAHLVAAGVARTLCGARGTKLALDDDEPRCETCQRIAAAETMSDPSARTRP